MKKVALTFFLFSTISYAQNRRFFSLELNGAIGENIYTAQKLSDYLDDGFESFDVKLAFQPSDNTKWYRYYRYPSYGLGFSKFYPSAPNIIGNPNAIYGFIDFPMGRYHPGKRNKLFFSTAFGLGFGVNPIDLEENPLNDAMSSSMGMFTRLGLIGNYQLSPRMDLVYGLVFNHMSNGRLRMPNQGLNMFGLTTGLKYHFTNNKGNQTDFRFEATDYQRPSKVRENSINISESIGFVQLWEDIGSSNVHFVNIVRLDFRRKFDIKNGLTVGLDWFYDTSLEEDYPGNVSHFAGHVGYDYMFYDFAVRMQVGTYIGDDKNKFPVFARVEFQYELSNFIQFQVGIKSNSGLEADWFEMGFSLRPFRWVDKKR